MNLEATCQRLYDTYVVRGSHGDSDYFRLIKELLKYKDQQDPVVEQYRSRAYQHIEDEIISNSDVPCSEISFGTSGWRGVLGKDIFVGSVKSVTNGIVELYYSLESSPELAQHLGVSSLEEARRRGCLVGFDNRFGGDILAQAVCDVLIDHGFQVYFCGETTTGVLSAALLELDGAFSVNLTPSHNPLEYGGYKFNAADAGPAASELTSLITKYSRQIASDGVLRAPDAELRRGELQSIDSFSLWQKVVNSNEEYHGIDYSQLIEKASAAKHVKIVVDSVHGASRLHIERLFGKASDNVSMLRGGADVSFGGIAPEPSSVNMAGVGEELRCSDSQLRVG
ncbi:MAG: phosphoglucomutase, partial [Deltaproteobacteria bacterium]|nr:phosphoglucomutase [Deltaproteobacteria bacterium]